LPLIKRYLYLYC